ncbi:hypothetical protein CT0861_06952 [Colletotrichum tofieldiae]|uniref:Uncharacterized protein n=1 Tax=Colletotrichum tofieldiae TaxID=708197 RepID=A0A166VLN0_9PEZI|nr:hypothetical protein CT0861_06952 [Colletotrichum tofieldiae]
MLVLSTVAKSATSHGRIRVERKTPEATAWGSFAGKPIRPRPVAGAPGVRNGPDGSTSQTKAIPTSVTAPRKQENGKWGAYHSRQVQGPALDPKVRRRQRQRSVKAPPKYAPAPRWSPNDLPSGERTERWGVSYVLQNFGTSKDRRLGADSSITRTAGRDEAAVVDALETPSLLADDTLGEEKGLSVETEAPENPSKPAQEPGIRKWGDFNWQGRSSALTRGGGKGSARHHLEQRETNDSSAADGIKPDERCKDTSRDRSLLALLERKSTSALGASSGSLVREAETKIRAQRKSGLAPEFFTRRDVMSHIQRDQAQTQKAPTMVEPTELQSANTSLLLTKEEFISLARRVGTETRPITTSFRSKERSGKREDRRTVLTKDAFMAVMHGSQKPEIQAPQRGRSRRGRPNGPVKAKFEKIPEQDKPPAYPASHATTQGERRGLRDPNLLTKDEFAFLFQGNETLKKPFATSGTGFVTKAEVLSYLQVPEVSLLAKLSGTRQHEEKHSPRNESRHNRPDKWLSTGAVNRNQQSVGSTGSPVVHEEIERHFRKTKFTTFRRFSDEHSANDQSQRMPGDYVRDWPSWIEMLLTKPDTPSHHSVEDMRQLMLPRAPAAHNLPDAEFMAAVETALDRIWTEDLFPGEHIFYGHRRRALRAAVRKTGASQNTYVEHIQHVMQGRPEWANWYRYVFLSGNKHEQRKVFRKKARLWRRGR